MEFQYDDEIVQKGSPLYHHLMDNNLRDFEVMDMAAPLKSDFVNITSNLLKPQNFVISAGDKMMFRQFVEQILCTELLIFEDCQLLEMTLTVTDSKHNIKTLTYLNNELLVKLTYTIFGSNLLWRYRQLPLLQFLILSPSIVYFGHHLYHKYKDYCLRTDLTRLLSILKRFYKTMKKTMKTIQDYSTLVGSTIASLAIDHLNKSTALILYDTIQTLQLFKADVKKLLTEHYTIVPTFLTIETDFSDEHLEDEKDMTKLYYMYLIVQSELLRLLGLSYSIHYWKQLEAKLAIQQFHTLQLKSTIKVLQQRLDRAQDAFQIFQSVDNKRREITKPTPCRPHHNVFLNTYQMTLQFHSILDKCWDLVTQLEATHLTDNQTNQIQLEYAKLLTDIKSVEDFLKISQIQLSKLKEVASPLINQNDIPKITSNVEFEKQDNLKIIDLNEENVIEDQIFEAHIKATDQVDANKHSKYDLTDHLQNKHESVAKATMLKELQKVLQSKRTEWNQREAKIKGEIIPVEHYDPQTTTNSDDYPNQPQQLTQFRHKVKKSDSRQSESSSSSDDNPNTRNEDKDVKDQQYFGPKNTTHVLPHPRRISKYKNVRDKAQKPKPSQTKIVPKIADNWGSNESNDDSDINIPKVRIGFGNILPPITAFRQEEESLSAVGELSDSDSERK